MPTSQLRHRIHSPPLGQLRDQQKQSRLRPGCFPVRALNLFQQPILIQIRDPRGDQVSGTGIVSWITPTQTVEQFLGQ
jgi:hypothetical protein